jgi:hypothetical protein
MSADEVAKAFVQHFYTTFDSNLDSLAGLYVSLQLLVVEMRSSGVLHWLVLPVQILRTFHEDLSLVTCAGGGPSSSRLLPHPVCFKTMKVASISMVCVALPLLMHPSHTCLSFSITEPSIHVDLRRPTGARTRGHHRKNEKRRSSKTHGEGKPSVIL